MTERAMAMILLRSRATALDGEAAARTLTTRFATDPQWRVLPGAAPAGSLLLAQAGQAFLAAQVDAPVPAADIARYAADAYWWPTARQDLSTHRAHLIVSTLARPGDKPADALAVARSVTRLAGVLVAEAGGNAVAGLWTNAGTAQPATAFAQQSMTDFPLNLWLDIRLMRGSQPNEIGIATRGLRLFRGLELVIAPTSVLPPEQLAKRCTDIALYLVRGGDLRDGDTIAGGRAGNGARGATRKGRRGVRSLNYRLKPQRSHSAHEYSSRCL